MLIKILYFIKYNTANHEIKKRVKYFFKKYNVCKLKKKKIKKTYTLKLNTFYICFKSKSIQNRYKKYNIKH